MNKAVPPYTEHCGSNMVYPYDVLKSDLEEIKVVYHDVGLKFYAVENRLCAIDDSLNYCGTAGLKGFSGNTLNLNHCPIRYTFKMEGLGTGGVFRSARWATQHEQ